MRLIETIKIVDGKCLNIDYHSQRASCEIPLPSIANEFCRGVVKWRIVYENGLPFENHMMHYQKPKISSLALVDGSGIGYSKKYENREKIDKLMTLRGSCDDILIVKDGMVSDTSFCNIVFESKFGLFTPSTPLLRGIKRQKLLDEGVIEECRITVEDIPKYRKAYLINAMIELEDNISINPTLICQLCHG